MMNVSNRDNQPSQKGIVVVDDYTVTKKKDSIIIFGRSPFINQLNLSKIDYSKFDVCCINYPIPDIKVKYIVSADSWVRPVKAPKTEWVSRITGWFFKKSKELIRECKSLSWLHYSSGLAVNFAILRGYKNIYLGGIDLIEEKSPFVHYDGIVNNGCGNPNSRREEKEYIKNLCREAGVNIYQLNPQADWLEYRDIGLL